MDPRIFLIGIVIAGVSVSGCGGNTALRRSDDEERPAQKAVLASVPFFPDRTRQCGPSTLASLLAFYGHPVTPEDLRARLFTERLDGSLPLDMFLVAKQFGLDAHTYEGRLDDIRAEIKNGRPVIALLNLGLKNYPLGHFVVVTGYDDLRGGLLVHSGAEAHRFVSYARFMKYWSKAQHWTLAVRKREEDAEITRQPTVQ